eukprot:25770_1
MATDSYTQSLKKQDDTYLNCVKCGKKKWGEEFREDTCKIIIPLLAAAYMKGALPTAADVLTGLGTNALYDKFKDVKPQSGVPSIVTHSKESITQPHGLMVLDTSTTLY